MNIVTTKRSTHAYNHGHREGVSLTVVVGAETHILKTIWDTQNAEAKCESGKQRERVP